MKQIAILTAAALILLSAAITPKTANAQDHEVGLFLGFSNYAGDLEETRLNFEEINFAFGGLYRYYFTPRINLKGSVYFGHISGDDAHHIEERGWTRELSFRSRVLDGSLQLEWNILPFVPGSESYRFAPYLFGGVSVFNFNPQAETPDGDWVDLQPLGTEGQNIDGHEDGPYALTQIAIPMGIGLKYNISGKWNLGLEVGARKTFTDYLDDVSSDYADPDAVAASAQQAGENPDHARYFADPTGLRSDGHQRGNPDAADWYAFSGITITYTIRSYECNGDW